MIVAQIRRRIFRRTIQIEETREASFVDEICEV